MKLSELCDKIGSGATPKGGSTVYVAEGVSLIRSQNVYNNRFDFDGLCHVTDEAAHKLDSVTVRDGDVLLNITGDSVARCTIVPRSVLPARVNQHVAIIRPRRNRLDNQFLMYYLTSPWMQAVMLGLAVGKGASRNALTKGQIENFEIPDIPIDVQRKIVGLLAPYDSLIENNRRQIKLLEEAAQRLYKEWFVDLRFPGHEHTLITNGVPQGWRYASVTDLLDVRYGKDHKSIESGIFPVYGSGGVMRYVNRFLYSGESVLIPRKGSLNNIMLVSGDFWTIDTMFYGVPKRENVAKFVYHYLKIQDMAAHNIGAAVPSMTVTILSGINFLLPEAELLVLFEKTVSPWYKEIENYKKAIKIAAEARDRLLPKLMTGEIEVQELP